MSAASTDHLTEQLGPTVQSLGLDLDALELSTAGRRRVLRVVVDRDGGVSLDDIATVTRAVSRQLDSGDALGDQPYTLEVTSRGVDRPLSTPRHWRRNVGRLVTVATTEGGPEVTGRITAADDNGADLAVGSGRQASGTERVEYAQVRRALIQVEFARKEG
jgi:ribosome maturation factor RimP